jgi:hypothetical protein
MKKHRVLLGLRIEKALMLPGWLYLFFLGAGRLFNDAFTVKDYRASKDLVTDKSENISNEAVVA